MDMSGGNSCFYYCCCWTCFVSGSAASAGVFGVNGQQRLFRLLLQHACCRCVDSSNSRCCGTHAFASSICCYCGWSQLCLDLKVVVVHAADVTASATAAATGGSRIVFVVPVMSFETVSTVTVCCCCCCCCCVFVCVAVAAWAAAAPAAAARTFSFTNETAAAAAAAAGPTAAAAAAAARFRAQCVIWL